jgi:hypothetical protein
METHSLAVYCHMKQRRRSSHRSLECLSSVALKLSDILPLVDTRQEGKVSSQAGSQRLPRSAVRTATTYTTWSLAVITTK